MGAYADRNYSVLMLWKGTCETKTACDRTVPQRNLWERMRTEITLF